MKAGRELDILVAEKVMGWTRIEKECEDSHPYYKEYRDGEDCCPSFSTMIWASWNVVDRMREHGFSVKIWQPAKERGPDGAFVSFICGMGPCYRHGNPRNNHHGAYDIDRETLPLAVCEAALIALGPTSGA